MQIMWILFKIYTVYLENIWIVFRSNVDVQILFMILTSGVLAFCGSPLVPACAAVGTIGGCNKKKKERLINVLNMK